MNKIFSLINNNWKYVAGGSALLGYQTWYDRLKAKETSLINKEETNANFNKLLKVINNLL